MNAQLKSRAWCLLGICSLWLNIAIAQQFPAPGVAIFGAAEGLKQNTITRIYPDSAGYLWVGTFAGLHRFNGYIFQTFAEKNPHLSKELRQVIRDVVRVDNAVYFSTEENLLKLHLPEDSVSVVWKYDIKGNACRIFKGSRNRLLLYQFGVNGGIFVLNPVDDSLERLQSSIDLREYADVTYRNDTLALIKNGEITAFDFTGSQFDILNNSNVESIYFLNHGKMIICSNDGITNCELRSGNCVNLDFELMSAVIVWPTINGYALTGTADGIYLFNENNELQNQLTSKELNLKTLLSSTHINSLAEDVSGNIWVGIDGVGLLRINRLMPKLNLEPSPYFTGSFVRAVIQDKNDIWVGTFGGSIHRVSKNINQVFQLPDGVNVLSLIKSGEYELLVTTDRGVYEFNSVTSKFQLLDKQTSVPIYSNLVKTKSGRIFSAVQSTPELLEIIGSEKSKEMVSRLEIEERIRALFHFKDERILIALSSGGFRMWDAHLSILSDVFIPDLRINDVKILGDSAWFATSTGLYVTNKKFELVNVDLPLMLNQEFLYSLAADKRGQLWIGSNVGLLCLNPSTNTLNAFTEHHGLQSNEFNTRCALELLNGNLVFGGVHGLNVFNPDEIFADKLSPPPILEWVKNAGNAIFINDRELPLIKLQQSKLALHIKLALLNLTASEYNQFSFALYNSGDTIWSDLGRNRDLFLQSVATGSYVLLGKAANSDGVWSNPVELLKLKITPPFYFTWWFIIIIFGMLGLFIFAITYLYFRRINESKIANLKIQQEKDAMRQRIADDIHDDLGAGLTRLTLMARQAANNNDSKSEKLNKISDMTKELTDSLRQVVWAMKPELDNVSGLFAGINSYAHEYLSESGIELKVNMPKTDVYLNPMQRQAALLILKESLNNILKHSNASAVEISLSIIENQLIMKIEDDGKGFDSTGKNSMSYGLSSMTRRALEAKGKVIISSAIGGPTRVLLTLDLK